MILHHLYKYTWVCQTISSAHIFHFSRVPKFTQSNLHFQTLVKQTSGRNVPLFLSTFVNYQWIHPKSPCRTSLPSSGVPVAAKFHTVSHHAATDRWSSRRAPAAIYGHQRLLSCVRPTERLLAPLTTKTEFTLNLLLCTSQNSFKDYHLLEFSSTASLHYQNLY